MEYKITELNNKIQRLESENSKLTNELRTVKTNRDSLQQERQEFQNRCSDLTTENMRLKALVNMSVCKKCLQRC
jgi:chromosome segregation ATPase